MSAKPANLTHLQHGKALCSAVYPTFVETWNWLVDFCANLKGEGEEDKSKSLCVDRSTEDHPVIRGGGGDGMNLICGDNSNVVFTAVTSGANKGKTKIDVYYV